MEFKVIKRHCEQGTKGAGRGTVNPHNLQETPYSLDKLRKTFGPNGGWSQRYFSLVSCIIMHTLSVCRNRLKMLLAWKIKHQEMQLLWSDFDGKTHKLFTTNEMAFHIYERGNSERKVPITSYYSNLVKPTDIKRMARYKWTRGTQSTVKNNKVVSSER